MKSLKICSEKPQTESLFPSPQRTGGQARGAEGGISVASGGERREQASPTPEYSDEEDGIELSPDSEKGLAPGVQGASGGLTGTPPDSEKVFGCAVPVSPIATRDAEVCAGAAGRRAEGQKIVLKRSEKKPAQKFSAGEQAVLSLNIFFSNDALLRKSLNRQITAYLEREWEKSKSSSIHPDFIHTPENKMVDYIESKPVVVEDFGEKSPGQYVLDLFSKDKNLQFCLSCLSPSTGLLTILQSEIQKTEQQELSALSHLIAEGKVCLNKLNVKWIKWDNASVWIELAFSADRNYLEEGAERKHTLAQGTLYALITPSGEGQRPGVEVSGLHIQGSPASRRSNTAFKVC